MKNLFSTALVLFSLTIFSSISNAQVFKNILGNSKSDPIPSNEQMAASMRLDVVELTQAKYDGRKLGTTGFKNVTTFLERRMQQSGLLRYGTIGYRSEYKFPVGMERTINTKFYIDGKSLHIGSDVLPLAFGSEHDVDAYIVPGENSAFSPWTIPLPSGNLTKETIQSSLKSIIINAQTRGATAVYFYDNSLNNPLDLKKLDTKSRENIDTDITIPVWIISKKAWEDNFKNKFSLSYVQSQSRYKTIFDDGFNIVGLIDNKAAKTILISADFDCLFPDVSSPGANANATGVAAVLQLSTILADKSYNSYNYAFALFSGSEIGQFGVKSFLSIPEMDKRIAYVVDLTALGSMTAQNELEILGAASSALFRSAIKEASPGYSPIIGSPYPYSASYDEFLNRKIPTLSISTGFDSYDAKTDRLEKVNFVGLSNSVRFVAELIAKINSKPNPPIFAQQPASLVNADLVFPKAAPVYQATPATKESASSRFRVLFSGNNRGEKVDEAKARLASNSKTGKDTKVDSKSKSSVSKNATSFKKPVARPYSGRQNVVVDFLGLGVNELDDREGGAIIQSVDAKGKGAILGIAAGDTILQIGSMPVTNSKTYLYNLTKYKEGERAYFKVQKATTGQTLMINVDF